MVESNVDPANEELVRAEHPSLHGYLNEVLTAEQRSRLLLPSFNQWGITTAVVGEIAATLHDMSDTPIVALWADRTPVKDVGWTTSRRLSRLFLSPSRDDHLRKSLLTLGLPRSAFPNPPIKRWRPVDALPKVERLNRSSIRRLTYRGAPVGRAVLQVHPDTNTPVTDDYLWPRRWVELCVQSFAYVFDQTLELIEQGRAKAMAVFNGRFLHDAAATAAAQRAGIPVLAYDFGGNDTDFDLTIDDTHDWSALQRRMLRLYESWDPDERQGLGSSWFEDRRTHRDPRNALFVESQDPGTGVALGSGQKLVAFFSSSGDEISELDLDWTEYFNDQPGALKAVAEVCRTLPNTTFLIRTHPHKRMKPERDVADWHAAVAQASPDIHLDEFSNVDSYTLMSQADVVVTYGSTTGVEAAYAKRPVVVLGPSAYDELGCALRVRTLDELRAALSNPTPGDWDGALAYGLMMRRRGFHATRFSIDDKPGSRTLQVLRDSNSIVLRLSDLRAKRMKSLLRSGNAE